MSGYPELGSTWAEINNPTPTLLSSEKFSMTMHNQPEVIALAGEIHQHVAEHLP